MTRKERKMKQARLNEVVVQWKTTPKEGNAALLESLWTEIFILFFDLYDNENDIDLYYKEGTNYVLKVFERTLREYDPSKGPYSHYASKSLKWEKLNKIAIGKEVSLDLELELNDDSVSLKETLQDDKAANPEESVLIGGFSAELAAIILDFASRRPSKKNNKSRLLWYKLFYTEDMTYIWKMQPIVSYAHDRDIWGAIEKAYLDYYMLKECNTGEEVSKTRLKPYEEVVPSESGNRNETPLPLPADVSISFLTKASVSGATRSNRSNYIKDFKRLKNDILWKDV